MKGIFKHIEGDRTIWALVAILALFSFMPVYSASANLVSVVGGSTLGYLLKHVVLLIMGFAIIYAVHKIPYRYFSGGSVLLLPVVFFLLIYQEGLDPLFHTGLLNLLLLLLVYLPLLLLFNLLL